MVRQILFRTIVIDIGSTAIEFCRGLERLGLKVNTAWARGNLYLMNRVDINGWKITNRKHPGKRGILAKPI